MKFGACALGTLGLWGFSSTALAEPPPPRTGFQLAIRTGYSAPIGKADGPDKFSNITTGQIPLLIDVGAKLIPELFLGGYFGFGFGGAGGTTQDVCNQVQATCMSLDLRLGIEGQYQFLPAGLVDPWLGYGLGFESFALTKQQNGVNSSVSLSGFEFARFMGGVDFRVHRVFGVGPFVDLSMGSFSRISDGTTSERVTETTIHQWLTFGARFVFFP